MGADETSVLLPVRPALRGTNRLLSPVTAAAGPVNIFAVLLVGLTCGTLNRLGVTYGVRFMSLHAAPWLVAHLM